jgi:tripartite-type tricarboxylate transporter receptor subunit TctC
VPAAVAGGGRNREEDGMKPAFLIWLLLFTIVPGGIAPAQAQYPAKPIRFILPFPPGGGTDTLGRIIGTRLGEALGQTMVMENRPGAGATIGAEVAARTPPDGYTLLMGNVAHTMGASLYKNLKYDLVKDFDPVSLLASTPNIVVVHPSVPATTLKALIALARARPGDLDVASSGHGSSAHLAGELFHMLAGTKMNHVPYKGGGPAMLALVSGEVSVGFATAPSVIHHIKAGKVRALAVTSAGRAPFMPELPTVDEAGVKGYEATTWYGILVPAGTPRAIITRLNAESVKVIHLPDVKERLESSGFAGIGSTPEAFGSYLRSEIEKWGKVIRAAGVRIN